MDKNWQQVRRVFDEALLQTPEDRQKFVKEACGRNITLQAEVESLLKSHDSADSFMETPAVAKVADAIQAEQKRIAPGTCFGHYEIIKQIGTGGMGEVYLAKDKKLDRQVAIKLLNEKFSGQESNLQRFIKEAKAASALNHPNILTIYEFGEAEDSQYIVSEYVEGKTLREILRESRPRLSEILDISIQIAGALSSAHKAHLVHRDIKPENIMMRPDRYVKILDFGLAKLIQPNPLMVGLEAETAQQSETAKGVIMGTVNYMSPEQAKGERVDERTDIFSFGVVIYEMLTSRTPFQGNSVSETFANLINAEPQSLEQFASDVPTELEHIVLKMLSKDKSKRFQSMKGLSTDLKNLFEKLKSQGKLDNSPDSENETRTEIMAITTGEAKDLTLEELTEQTGDLELAPINPVIKKKPKYRAWAVVGLILALALAGISYRLYRNVIVNESKTPLVFKAGQITRLTSSGRVIDSVISPDGKFVIYAQSENNEQQSLWTQHLGSGSNMQIVPPTKIEYRSLNISPDSNSLYYHDAKGILYRIAVLGGTPKKIAEGIITTDSHERISLSPDGTQIGFIKKLENGEKALFRANNDGTNGQLITSLNQPSAQSSAWSPDGQTIAIGSVIIGSRNILAVRVADGKSSPILQTGWYNIYNWSWMPDSKSLLVIGIKTDENISAKIWQVSYPDGKSRQLTEETNNYASLNTTSDGRSLVVVRNEIVAQVWTGMNEVGNSIQQITAGFEKLDGTDFLYWMPDDKIVFDSVASGKFSGWMVKPSGGNAEQLLKDDSPEAISSDGRYLLFLAKNGKDGLLRILLEDGSVQVLTDQPDYTPAFSPDGKWIIFQRFGENIGLWKIPIEGGEPTLISKGYNSFPVVSPDGKKIAFILNQSSIALKVKIALISFDGGQLINTFEFIPQIPVMNYGRIPLRWTPDGRGIYFIALNDGVSNIWRQPINGSPPVQVTKFETGRIFNFAYSPDGKQLALSRGSLNSDVILIKNSE